MAAKRPDDHTDDDRNPEMDRRKAMLKILKTTAYVAPIATMLLTRTAEAHHPKYSH